MSKLRDGLQLWNKVRFNDEDHNSGDMKTLQMAKNRLLKALNNSRISDKISTKNLLNKFNLLSVNQLVARSNFKKPGNL